MTRTPGGQKTSGVFAQELAGSESGTCFPRPAEEKLFAQICMEHSEMLKCEAFICADLLSHPARGARIEILCGCFLGRQGCVAPREG